ncbi:MAG: Dabb family protein [Bacteroidota bacterium]
MQKILSICISALLLIACSSPPSADQKEMASAPEVSPQVSEAAAKQLRHVVLFKFKEGSSEEDIKKVEEAFSALPSKIPQIKGYEWGTNNSPEGLDKGFTHCFFLSFESEEDRAIYLPHPDHKAFGEVLGPHLDDVLVLDYWTD